MAGNPKRLLFGKQPNSVVNSDIEKQLVAVNASRASEGKAPLTYSEFVSMGGL
jgi:hypothetical protein